MNIYSVIMLDIDGTLLDSRNQVSPNTKKLLNRLEKRGIPIVLNSARAPGEIDLVVRQAGLRDGPIVCYGGSLILDENRSIIEDTGIEPQAAVKFKEYVQEAFPGICVSSYLYDVWVTDHADNPYIRQIMEITHREPLEGPLESAARMCRHVHKLLCTGTPVEMRSLLKSAGERFPALQLLPSGAIYMEVIASHVSKYTAMEQIRRYYRVDMEQVVAVGDYFVDIEMLKHAGLGIAMGNAPEAVRQAADRVTASNDEDGVYIALKNLRFRPPLPLSSASPE